MISQPVMGLRPCSTSQCWLSIPMWNLNLQLRRIAIQKWRQQRPRICSVRSLCVASVALALILCLGCIPPFIGLSFLRFYAVVSSLFLLFVFLFIFVYRNDVLCWLLSSSFSSVCFPRLSPNVFPVDLVWFRLSCVHGWIRSGSVNVR